MRTRTNPIAVLLVVLAIGLVGAGLAAAQPERLAATTAAVGGPSAKIDYEGVHRKVEWPGPVGRADVGRDARDSPAGEEGHGTDHRRGDDDRAETEVDAWKGTDGDGPGDE